MASINKSDLFAEIRKLLATQLKISEEEISGGKEIVKDLGADSLDIVEMLMTLEDEHHITVPDNETEGIKTVQDVVDLVGKYI